MISQQHKFSDQSGIAIGPILFVLALLAVLAAAVATGAGGFSSGTSTESSRGNASGIIMAGTNLRAAMDRLVAGTGADPATVSIDPTSGTGLFAPASAGGGGAAIPGIPQVASAVSPAGWRFVDAVVDGMGSGSADRIAVVQVTQGKCQQINSLLFQSTTVPQLALGANNGTGPITNLSALPALINPRIGFCIEDTTSATAGYYFVQVLSAL